MATSKQTKTKADEKNAAQAAQKEAADQAAAAKAAEAKQAADKAAAEADQATAETRDWAEVFECYPDVKEIYVVGTMPFLTKEAANGHARDMKVEGFTTVTRP